MAKNGKQLVMISTVTTDTKRISRCAVCKIDLKGRFVFVDDLTADLLGCTKEQLFGQNITEYLDDRDHEIVEHMLATGSHYETFYDSTCLKFKHKSNRTIKASVVVSLNFIAGNPVNFQFIINSHALVNELKNGSNTVSQSDEIFERFVNELPVDGQEPNWTQLCERLVELTRAETILVYDLTDDKFDLIESFHDELIDAVPPISKLIEQVAEDGKTYDPTDDDSVRIAIELIGTAPNEFVFKLNGSNSSFLLRVIANSEKLAELDSSMVRSLKSATKLIELSLSNSRNNNSDIRSGGYSSLAEILGRVDVGFLQIDPEGRVVAHNQKLAKLFPKQTIPNNIEDIKELLSQNNSTDTLARFSMLAERVASSDENSTDELLINVPSGIAKRIIAIETKEPDSCQLLFIPMAEKRVSRIPYDNISKLVSFLSESAQSIGAIGEKLAHDFHGDLTTSGNISLQSMLKQTNLLRNMHSQAAAFIQSGKPDQAELTDLNLLFNQTIEELQNEYPTKTVTCEVSKLPKVVISRKSVSLIIRNLLDNCFRHATGKLHLNVKGSHDQGYLNLEILDNGSGITKSELGRLFDLEVALRRNLSKGRPLDRNLAYTRMLAKQLGGSLNVKQNKPSGLHVRIKLPIDHNRSKINS